ncbi:CARDB domain-containing protein [Calditrichota bacterium]
MMKKGILALFTVLMLIAMTSAVFADQLTPQTTAFNPFISNGITFPLAEEGRTMLLPDGRNTANGELDETWDDSIYYYQPNGYNSLTIWEDYWSATRFTPTANFTLQGIRFCPLNQRDNETDECEVYVYTDDNGEPGEPLNDGNPVYNDILPAFGNNWADRWAEVNFEELEVAEMEFEEGEDFWIIFGRAPGGNGYPDTGGWWNIMDQGLGAGDRSQVTRDEDPGDADWSDAGGDLFITAEGQLELFIDLSVRSLYNDINKFFFPADTEVQLSAIVKNLGNDESPDVEIDFSIVDEEDNEVYSGSADVDAIDAGDSTEVDAPDTWTPEEDGYYYVTAELSGDNMEDDPNPDNDEYMLIQGVVGALEADYLYDDGSFEYIINFNDRGPGVGFKPIDYPAQLNSASFYIAYQAGLDSALFMLTQLTMDNDTTFNLLWSGRANVDSGWVSLEIRDENGEPYQINEGMFVPAFIGENTSFVRDNDPPAAGSNPEMHDASFDLEINGQQVLLYWSQSGNWAIRANISVVVPPEIVFPNTTIDFGEVEANTSGFAQLSVVNNGEGTAVIDSIIVGVAIRDVVAVVDDLPIEIVSGEEITITLEWVPPDEDSDLDGVLGVFHNDPELTSPQAITVSGTAYDYVKESNGIPNEYFLAQNFPNPFNPTTDIRFGLKDAGQVKLTVYNVTGQRVMTLVDGDMTAGYYHATFDARDMATGIYYYAIEVNGFRDLKKMVMLK